MRQEPSNATQCLLKLSGRVEAVQRKYEKCNRQVKVSDSMKNVENAVLECFTPNKTKPVMEENLLRMVDSGASIQTNPILVFVQYTI